MDHDVSAGLDHAEAETAARSDVRHRASGTPLPAQIGPYHIIELLGQGGMGAVYLAEQTQPFRRRVAVKVIKPGMDSEQVIARFETERQALALMNHPNVARVLDAGTTADGRPYFVMEHVAGIPITRRRRPPPVPTSAIARPARRCRRRSGRITSSSSSGEAAWGRCTSRNRRSPSGAAWP